jgi:two-component system cell cycle response regulator
VEDDLEDENLLREALAEMEEELQWGYWRSCELTQTGRLEEALDWLEGARYDAVLLNLSLPGSPNLLETFCAVFEKAGETPIVVLADAHDPSFDARLIREGAQDVILKSELECGMLARALRHAMERRKRMASLESRFLLDDLTGLYDREGFLRIAGHYMRIARHTSQPLLMAAIDAGGRNGPSADLMLIRAAELGRGLFPEATLLGRISARGLGLATVGVSAAALHRALERLSGDLACGLRFHVSGLHNYRAADAGELLMECERKLADSAGVDAKTAMLAD